MFGGDFVEVDDNGAAVDPHEVIAVGALVPVSKYDRRLLDQGYVTMILCRGVGVYSKQDIREVRRRLDEWWEARKPAPVKAPVSR